MKYLVLFLILFGFTGTVYASESLDIDYFSNPEFQIYKINEQRHTFFIPYSISNSKINDITMDCPSRAMIIDIETAKEAGSLIIVMPRTLLDSRYGTNDDSFFILIDGQEIEYSEIEKNTDARVLKISFSENSSQIEIIVATLISQSNDSLKFASCGQADPKESPFYQVLSPLKQFKSGIEPKDVVCKSSLELVIKKSNNQPVCIKGTSVKTLTLRNYIPEYNGSLGGEIPSNNLESMIKASHIEITGVINHWQPIDGPAYSLIVDEPINAQVSDIGIFLYGDMLRPYMKNQTVTIKGTLIPNYAEYQKSLGFSMMGGEPSTATILVDEIQIQESKVFSIKGLLNQNHIDYHSDKLFVTSGVVFEGDPGCGAIIDVDSVTHWFSIDSISNPKNMTLYSENPGMCIVNTRSCFCNVQIELTALTLKELSYFTIQEEEKYSNLLIDYLDKENINRTPKFMIGKLNLNYTDSLAIGYCGKMWGENDYGFFSGEILNDRVMGYGISEELPKLCAISNDAKYFGKAFGEK